MDVEPRQISRRMVLAGAACTGAWPAAALGTGRPGLRPGINLYMVAALYAKDPDGTLAALARIGFREVEASLDTVPPERTRAALDRSGLRCINLGTLPQPFRGGMSLQTETGVLAAAAHVIGAEYVTCTLFPLPAGVEMRPLSGETVDRMLERVTGSMKADDWKRAADFLNAKGAEFRRHGIRFAYHNHNAELAPHGETNGLAILLEHTDPATVCFEMDAGWMVAAGHDPVEVLRAYPNRFRLMHVKDVAQGGTPNTAMRVRTTPVGEGTVDWPRVLRAARASGVRHFAIEAEPPYTVPPLEVARRSFAYLSSIRA